MAHSVRKETNSKANRRFPPKLLIKLPSTHRQNGLITDFHPEKSKSKPLGIPHRSIMDSMTTYYS